MQTRILDLDGSLLAQPQLLNCARPALHDLHKWGPRLRLGCGFRRFEQFESALANRLDPAIDEHPALTFLGSGDFHHLTLALLRRIQHPFNLLVVDNHPDWVRGIPFMHCGTWVHHAAQLANVRTIFHVGGDVDFDNRFRRLAPWASLRSGKIQVISAIRCFQRGEWARLAFPSLRIAPDCEATVERIEGLIDPFRDQLACWPLYVSVDKDVLTTRNAVVNWDSGHLTLAELQALLEAFVGAARCELAGMDVVGDWSPVRLRGMGRWFLHLSEHPRLRVNPTHAAQCNQRVNVELVRQISTFAQRPPKCRESALGPLAL